MAGLFVFIFIILSFGVAIDALEERSAIAEQHRPALFAGQMINEHRAQLAISRTFAPGSAGAPLPPITFDRNAQNAGPFRVFSFARQLPAGEIEISTIGQTLSTAKSLNTRLAVAREIKKHGGGNLAAGILFGGGAPAITTRIFDPARNRFTGSETPFDPALAALLTAQGLATGPDPRRWGLPVLLSIVQENPAPAPGPPSQP